MAFASGSGSRGRYDDGDDGNPFPPKKLCSTSLKLQFEADHYPVWFLEKYRPGLEYNFIEESNDCIREFQCKNQREKESIIGEVCSGKHEAQDNVPRPSCIDLVVGGRKFHLLSPRTTVKGAPHQRLNLLNLN